MDILKNWHSGLFSAAVVAAMALVSVGCRTDQSQSEWWQGEQERIGLSQQLELCRFRLELRPSGNLEELNRLSELVQANASVVGSLQRQLHFLNEEVESLERNRADFKLSTIRERRHEAIGKVFETFQSASGRKFLNASVTAIDDAGVTIRHADGSARLRFADLDAGQQVFFGMDAGRAFAAEEKESFAAIAYERELDRQMAAIRLQEREDDLATQRNEVVVERKAVQLAARFISASMAVPLARHARSIGRGSRDYFGYYPRYRYRSNYSIYRHVYYYSAPSYGGVSRTIACPQVTRAGMIY